MMASKTATAVAGLFLLALAEPARAGPPSTLEGVVVRVVAGDTLFRGGIGRTDLWGGDEGAILRSIKNRLLTLPDDTRVITGHGPDTTIGRERTSNPFLR